MPNPSRPKIYHIVHIDRLPSILQDGFLFCDRKISQKTNVGSMIGMNHIKQRRLYELTLSSQPGLYVGDCVPFYFCPRSVMLYLIYRRQSADIQYRGGQEPILHLEGDLHTIVSWAQERNLKWAFTTSNAGSRYFQDFADLSDLNKLRWDSIHTKYWSGEHKEAKQSEFLLQECLPWCLIERIGVINKAMHSRVTNLITSQTHKPNIDVKRDWYY